MTDIFLEFNDVGTFWNLRKRLCVRKDCIVGAWPNEDTGNADIMVLGSTQIYRTTIPYEEFTKQFFVIKMEEEK